jgi:antitoxin component YwqK of YwqJK toxin-antitoxin module/Tfp pilus assembly protein PilF
MRILPAAAMLLFSGIAFAQSVQPINSRELILAGSKQHDEGNFKQAINLYKQVPRNDTNYAWSLYETALSFSADSNNKSALRVIEEGLQLDNDDYEKNFMHLRGTVVDDEGNSERALRLYDSALLKYPNAQGVMLDKCITLIRLKKLKEAEKQLQNLLLTNPFYASAHFRLGTCALQQGKLMQAVMSYYTYLLLAPSGNYSGTIIKMLNSISKADESVLAMLQERSEQPSGNYAIMEQILLSKIALDKNYKIMTDLDDDIIRQLQVFMEKLKFEPSNNEFWMQFYVPYLKNVFEQHYFEPVVNYSFSNINIDKIQRYLKKNSKEVKEATTYIGTYLEKIRTTRELDLKKRTEMDGIYHYDNGVLFGKGVISKTGETTGYWEFFHSNGNLKSKGEFNSQGKKSGKWTYYYDNGTLSGYDNWINGDQSGEDLTYNKLGNLVTKINFTNGKINGEKKTFYALGMPYTITTFKDGVEEGKYTQYYNNGRIKVEATSQAGALQGIYKSYHYNGVVEMEANYEKDKLNGSYKSYFDNGKLELECTYALGELNGEVKNYFESGKLQKKSTYVNGVQEGEEFEYSEEGVVVYKTSYKKGKAADLARYYGEDGKLYSTFSFEGDKPREARYYDKSGKEISVSTRQSKQLDLTSYNEEGIRISKTLYNDKWEKLGTQTFYYPSGKTKETVEFQEGKQNGADIGYFPNGKKEYELNYKDDKKEGLARWYHQNGQLKSETWYTDGELNGNLIEYNEKGIITEINSYINGDQYGYKQSFLANGKPDDEDFFKYTSVFGLRQFDTTGKVILSLSLPNSTGAYKGIHFSGKPRFEGTYQQGNLQGKFTTYFFDGSVMTTRTYDGGYTNGPFREYFYSGQLATEGDYKMGRKTGLWKYYDAEGHLNREEPYVDGEINGKAVYYFENGKPERETEYKDGDRNGTFKRYALDGALACILYFKDNTPTGYSYEDKNGQMVPKITITAGTGKITTYFRNGNKSCEMEYADGKLNGDYKLYHSNGKLYYESKDEYGLTYGKLREYYIDGTLKTDYNYDLDNQDGPYKEFHPNGKVSEEGNFFLGYANGPRKFYDAQGKLIKTMNFYYGILLSVTK